MESTKSTAKCGQCRQFTRQKVTQKDYCEAWDQPTLATQVACGHFMAKAVHNNSKNKH